MKILVAGVDSRNSKKFINEYKKSGLSIRKFAEGVHTNNTRLVNVFRKYFPFEYKSFVEEKTGNKSSIYRRGRHFEYRVRNYYRQLGYYVLRSPISRGPADLVALKKGQILLIQCKINGMLYGREKNILLELAKSLGAISILAWRKKRKLIIETVVN